MLVNYSRKKSQKLGKINIKRIYNYFNIEEDYFNFKINHYLDNDKKSIDFIEIDSKSKFHYNPNIFSIFSENRAIECIVET